MHKKRYSDLCAATEDVVGEQAATCCLKITNHTMWILYTSK